MNERIQQLAKKCWDERPQGQLHFDNKKFAELIVGECIGIVLKEHDEGIDRHGDYQLACYELYREIKQHFGVEE